MGVQGNSEGGTDQVSLEGWAGRGLLGLWAGRRERVGGASRGCGRVSRGGRGLGVTWRGAGDRLARDGVGGASRGCGLRAREGFPGMGWAGLLE